MAKTKVYVDEGNSYSRNWALEIYPSWSNYDDIMEFVQDHYRAYAYILHDKDIWTAADVAKSVEYCLQNNIQIGDPKKCHVHIAIKFDNPRYRYTIAKELGIEDRFVRQCRKMNSFLKYLVHFDEYDKVAYPVQNVKGPLAPKVWKLCSESQEIEHSSDEIRELILSRPHWTLSELLKAVNQRGLYSVYRQGYTLYKDILVDHNMGIN